MKCDLLNLRIGVSRAAVMVLASALWTRPTAGECSDVLPPIEMKAGAAKVDITPPVGFPMWGYGARHDKPCEGVLDPLMARALVLEVGKNRLALVSLDLGRAPTRESMKIIRDRIKKKAGIDHVYLVASHTHHGPVLETDAWPDPKHPYVRELEAKLVDLMADTAGQLKPARWGIAARSVPFNRNRQSKRADKPVDPELIVLRFEDLENKPVATLVNFAAHPTMTDGKILKFSADYPGTMGALIEKETGAPCLFLQGAAGDLSPNPGQESGPGGFGKRLGQEVLDLSKTLAYPKVDKGTLKSVEEDFAFKCRVDLSNPLIKGVFDRAFYPELVDFYEREYREGVRPHLTVSLLSDTVGIVGVSGEFFCGHALSLKKRARLEYLLFLGYCNDYQQYFPTLEAASEGGYGTEPGVANAELGAGEQVMNRALLRLYQLRGRLPEDSLTPK